MISQSIYSYLIVSSALFAIGVFGLAARRNLVAILISLELILNSASLNFVAFGFQTFAVFIIALAAAEVCIGLSLILLLHRHIDSIRVDQAKELKG